MDIHKHPWILKDVIHHNSIAQPSHGHTIIVAHTVHGVHGVHGVRGVHSVHSVHGEAVR